MWDNKPVGGLWASDIDANCSWKIWNKEQEFAECNENNCFKFKLKKETRILTIKTQQDCDYIKSKYYASKEYTNWFDFEKIKKDYDVIDFHVNNITYFKFYGWDCDSILVLNKDCIKGVENI